MLSFVAEQSLTPPAGIWFASDIADVFDLWTGGITHGSHVLVQTPTNLTHEEVLHCAGYIADSVDTSRGYIDTFCQNAYAELAQTC